MREGNLAQLRLELDTEERSVTPPVELENFLKQDKSLRRWFDKLNHSTRADIAKWITDPKTAVARKRRAQQLAERLLNVMQAETELPPILQLAFSRQPRAREGWDAMSASRRRGHLFGIFYYRTPEAQKRRIDKAIEDAIAIAEKIRNKNK